jgi:hypothetical protein
VEPKLRHGDAVNKIRSNPNVGDESEAVVSSLGQQRQAGYQYPPVRLPKPPDKQAQLVNDKEEKPRWITRRGAEEGDALDSQSRRGEEERTRLRRVNSHCVTQVTHYMTRRVKRVASSNMSGLECLQRFSYRYGITFCKNSARWFCLASVSKDPANFPSARQCLVVQYRET